MPIAVNDPNDEIRALRAEWSVIEALMGGTPAMRKARTSLLPQWPNEEDAAYAARLETATLFPAFRRTVGVMAGKPFSKALTLSEAAPQIEQWATDIDRQGVNLHAFAAQMMAETVGYGLAGILVEYPPTAPTEPGRRRTLAQADAEGLRPYFVRVMHQQVLGWRTETVGGRVRLSQLRLAESREEPDGPYGTKVVPLVRVLYPGGWQVFAQRAAGWVLDGEGRTTLRDIPFVPLYGLRQGFMVGAPPLADLAYLNVKHWQSQSDQDTILHVARVPILAVMGVDDEAWQLSVGASTAVKLPQGGDMKFVEHGGAAIEAGAKSLEDLEGQMIQTGAELLVKKPGQRTATESANDAEANKSDLQRLTEQFEDALDQALVYAAEYAALDRAGSVSLFKDFGAATLSDASATLIKDLQQSGLLSKETALRELQRRGVIADDVDPADELEKAAADGPALATVGEGA